MNESWNNVKTVCCKPWLVLPTVYSDALSYSEQLDKFCYSLNKIIENNNMLPEYIAEKIKEYISSGAIGEVVRDILANYILNVKYPPKGITPAVGDGSADDTEAIQGCIDYAAENGGVVYFPYGNYLTQSLTIKNGVSLFGFDRYSTKIVLKGGATKALLNGNGNNLSVCNLTLDGNSGIQVSDVNVVDMTGSNLMFNDLVIKDGYKLFNFVGDGHLQLSNIVFGNAVENCFTVDGNVIVQTNNLLFTALSKVGGVSVIDIRANGGNYDFNSVAKCDTCMIITGNDNKVVAMIGGANEDYVDTGEHNNVEIVGHSQKEYFSGNVKKNANNSETTLQGTRSLHIVGNSTVAIDANSTESVDGTKSEIVTGVTTETYKNQRTVNDKSLNETTEKLTVTVNGEATENYNGDVTETYNQRTVTVNGEATENYNGDVTETYAGNYEKNLKTGVVNYEDLKLKNKNHVLNPYNVMTNVLDYGAKGDGVTDDYPAFKAAYDNTKNGGSIIVPIGVYMLSKNPDATTENTSSISPNDYENYKTWIVASGTVFKGNGVGDTTTGKGTFMSAFSTNPWITVSGKYELLNVDNVPFPTNGAIIADCSELSPIPDYAEGDNHYYCLKYQGACTGNSEHQNANVELLNQVLNITGVRGVATEIDLNVYKKVDGFCTGLFIVGNATVETDCTGIDINRDDSTCMWTVGMSLGQCKTGIWVKSDTSDVGFKYGNPTRVFKSIIAGKQKANGTDGIILSRFTDTDDYGTMIAVRSADEQTTLFETDTGGNVKANSFKLNDGTDVNVKFKDFILEGTFTAGNTYKIPYTVNGTPLLVGNITTLGFYGNVIFNDLSSNEITVYCIAGGTGSIKCRVLYK